MRRMRKLKRKSKTRRVNKMNPSKKSKTSLIKWEMKINQAVTTKTNNATTIPFRSIIRNLRITTITNIEAEGDQKVQRIKKL